MKKFTEEQKTLLSKAQPITRKWLCSRLEKDQPVPQAVHNGYNYLNTIEKSIYNQWHQDCLNEMQREKLNLSVPELYALISDPKVTVKRALILAQKFYSRKDLATKQKHIGKMISLIKKLADRETNFYQQASERLRTEKPNNVLEEVALALETVNRRDSEDLLYTRQSLKHIKVLRKLGFSPSVHEIYQALEPRFAGLNELYQKQIQVVMDTYVEGQDVPSEIKDVCFEFIKESIPHAGYFHANLIAYIFKNDTISEKAFQLFIDVEKLIKNQGMEVLVYSQAMRLIGGKKLLVKKPEEYEDSDLRILRLAKIFKPQRN